jgi:ABC-type transporter Mla subunit MlaD
VGASLEEILGKTRQVDNVIAEIATASQEQSQGITQVGSALNQMDKVTQSNAASAEETAAAAEQLNAQSMELNHVVTLLHEIIEGTRRNSESESKTIRPADQKPDDRLSWLGGRRQRGAAQSKDLTRN